MPIGMLLKSKSLEGIRNTSASNVVGVVMEYWDIHKVKTFTFHWTWTMMGQESQCATSTLFFFFLNVFSSNTQLCWGSPEGTACDGMFFFQTILATGTFTI